VSACDCCWAWAEGRNSSMLRVAAVLKVLVSGVEVPLLSEAQVGLRFEEDKK